MNRKIIPDQRPLEEIRASESLQNRLALLGAKSSVTSALVYTNGYNLTLGQTVSVDAIILEAVKSVDALREVLSKPRNSVPAEKDGS